MQKKIQKVEMKHAKEHAKKEADVMLQNKLKQCKDAYETEFESLCQQFSVIQVEVKNLKEDKISLKQKITQLEQIILQQNNLIETGGYHIKEAALAEIPPTSKLDKELLVELDKA